MNSPVAPSRWIRWVSESSAAAQPMPWTRVRPPRGAGIRQQHEQHAASA